MLNRFAIRIYPQCTPVHPAFGEGMLTEGSWSNNLNQGDQAASPEPQVFD